MTNEYKTGRIYKLYDRNDRSKCYIGSTFKTLNKRLKEHSSMYKFYNKYINDVRKPCLYYSCFQMFDPNDLDLSNIVIELLYTQRCSKKILKKIENKFISINPNSINIHRPRRTVDSINFTLFTED